MADETRRAKWWLALVLLSASRAASLSGAPAASGEGRSAVEAALHFFTGGAAGVTAVTGAVTGAGKDAAHALERRLDAGRPAPVSPTERQLVLATLPADGDVPDPRLTPLQRQKLAGLRRVLELHGRDTVYVVKVIELRRAAVALHARTVVLVTEPALDLLDATELQALVAHEIGHEYFWDDYTRARRDDDRPALRTLELLCDGVAIVTLRRAGADPTRLTSALDKLIRYNRDQFGAALNEDAYPAPSDRRAFARRLIAWLAAS